MSTVTALVSAYYASRFIFWRLQNLIQLQPYPEIIVVCKEGSGEHLISKENNIIHHLTSDIPTIYEAWNMGIYRTTGDYLTSANCDDLFYPQGLNIMSKYLDTHPEIDLVYGDCDIRIGDAPGIFPWKRGDTDLEHGINRIGAMPLWRRSLHDRFGMFDESMIVSGDYEFWLRCVRGGAKFHHLNETVGLYWKRADSLEHRNKAARKLEDARIEAV